MISLIQDFEADFLRKIGLKILNSGMIMKTFTHAIGPVALTRFFNFSLNTIIHIGKLNQPPGGHVLQEIKTI